MDNLPISIIPEFSKLLMLPKMCIFAFINQKDKKIYLGYSRDFLFSIWRNINQMDDKVHVCSMDKNLLELAIIETIKDDKDLRLRYRYWEEQFRKSGYNFYRNLKTINYRTKIEVIKKVKEDKNLLAVKLISNNSRTMEIVGLFDKIEEAEGFIQEHYSKSIVKIVYSENEYTKEYIKWIKKQS